MSKLLQTIRNPRDLRQLAPAKLTRLAEEVRESVRTRFTMPEAYMRSALGMADLTVALHFAYDFSHDRLVFDLSHQAAAHLVLTRHDLSDDGEMVTPMTPAFPGEEREPFDQFFARHPGTAISKALGLASATEGDGKTVAVIGDGAVVSGIALEALNNGASLDRDCLVILNDNEMSVSKVVGAMGEYLSMIRVGKTYNQIKQDAHKLLQSIPFFGESLDKAADQLKEMVAKALVPGSIFEKLGPRYFGPIDGHNVPHLVQLLQEVRRQRGFHLVHVITRREELRADETLELPRTLVLREEEKERETIEVAPTTTVEFAKQGEELYSASLSTALENAADADENVHILLLAAPDVDGVNRIASTLRTKLGDRFHHLHTNEPHGLAFAAGLARAGRRPVVVIPASVLHRAHDQVFQEVALPGLPIVVVVGWAGMVGMSGGIYHGCDDLAFVRSLPGLDVTAPRDGHELDRLIEFSVRQGGPSVIRIPHTFTPHADHVFPDRGELVRGRPEVLRRGSDVAVMALGSMVYPAMEAADLLAEKGIEATVVNGRFVRPLDGETIRAMLDEHSLLFTAEEHRLAGGYGSAVLEHAALERLDASRIIPIAVPDARLARGPRRRLMVTHGLDPSGIADRILHGYRTYVRSPRD